MARAIPTRRRIAYTTLAWIIALLIFFPILWTILTSFKTEADAIADPPLFVNFQWTLENYRVVQERSDYMRYLWELGRHRVGVHGAGAGHRGPGGLVHGLSCPASARAARFCGCCRPRCCRRWACSTRSG